MVFNVEGEYDIVFRAEENGVMTEEVHRVTVVAAEGN